MKTTNAKNRAVKTGVGRRKTRARCEDLSCRRGDERRKRRLLGEAPKGFNVVP